ncbi:MAG: glycosyltransferase family 4 protein [Candidatus Aegiribacteria sp.]|nr:glycosyltransferase family 4 protein [Candidatus Aegiribacteria sp.]
MKYKNTDFATSPATAVIYADSLSNKGGTGIYLKRLLEGFCQCDAKVTAAVGRKMMTPSEALSYPKFAGSIRKVINENILLPYVTSSLSPSIVHLPAFSGRTPPGIPCAVTLHDLAFCRNPSWFSLLRSIYYRLHFRTVARKADVVIVDSESTADEARKFLGIEKNRIRRVYLSTDSFMADPGVFRNSFSLQGRYIVYAGTIEPRKNISALLDSWKTVNRAHTDLCLVIAGRWGWGPEALRRKLLDTEGVLPTGPLSETMLRSCISGAELLVYPSLYEGFGLPPLEAASAGVPSVVTPASALKEIYSGISIMAEGFDPASISESILDSLDTEHDTAALLDFASEFSTELMAKEVLKVYEEFGT